MNLGQSYDAELCGVNYTKPEYARAVVDEAGKKLADFAYPSHGSYDDPVDWMTDYNAALLDLDSVLEVVNNWRSSHSFPLNTFQVTLKKWTRQVDAQCLVAQRIKRLSSIEKKLRRYPDLPLTEIQDIGGCRAVVDSVDSVTRLVMLYDTGNLKHKQVGFDNYISTPKGSGYRGAHLIYSYRSDRRDMYTDLKIEIQIRTTLQHYWATAVESVDIFTHQDLKSGIGQSKWRRFFALMGTVIADIEGTPSVPHTSPNLYSVKKELRRLEAQLDAIRRLQAYNVTLQHVNQGHILGAHYYLVKQEPSHNRVTVTGFKSNEPDKATEEYARTERLIKRSEGEDVVLVTAESMKSLMLAYPNYFSDTRAFIKVLTRALA